MYSLSFFFFFFKVFYCNNIKTAGETLISISFPNSRKSVSSAWSPSCATCSFKWCSLWQSCPWTSSPSILSSPRTLHAHCSNTRTRSIRKSNPSLSRAYRGRNRCRKSSPRAWFRIRKAVSKIRCRREWKLFICGRERGLCRECWCSVWWCGLAVLFTVLAWCTLLRYCASLLILIYFYMVLNQIVLAVFTNE